MSNLLSVNNLSCHYGNDEVIKKLSFDLAKGEIGGLLGPSGCGKTSVLRAIAGFLSPTAGEIKIDDKILSSTDTLVSPEDRKLGMVYQDYALFPHLNVLQNICFGIYRKPKAEQRLVAAELLDLIQLSGHEKRMPDELSGGEQQRVALARSLATNPQVLLLDEPFSGLDTELRRDLSHSVRDILKKRQTTALIVTHDQEEAFAVADQIGVIHHGQLQQWDSAYNLYHHPENEFVADFIGRGSFLRGILVDNESANTELGKVKIILAGQPHLSTGTELKLLLRPDNLVENGDSTALGQVIKKIFMGDRTIYRLCTPAGEMLEAKLSTERDYQHGENVGLKVESSGLVAFPYKDTH